MIDSDCYTFSDNQRQRATEHRELARAWFLRALESSRGSFSPEMSKVASMNLSKGLANMKQAAACLIPCDPYSGRPVDVIQDGRARVAWWSASVEMGIPSWCCRDECAIG